jgi:hypothetical protein
MSPSIKRPFWIVNAVSSHQVHAEFDRVLDWPHDAFPAELYRPQTTHKGDEAMGLVQMMDRPQQVDPLLTAEDVAARLNVSKDSRVATTTDVYMQELPESVRATIDSIHQELVGTANHSPATQMVN